MAVGGEVTFQAKLDTQIFDRAFARVEGTLKNAPVIEFKADITDIYKAADAFTDAVSRASQFAQNMDVVANQLGNAAQRINGLAGSAITAANQFESAKAAAATLTGDADGLAISMKALSRDLNFQASSTELLKASYDVLSAGFVSTADSTDILKASFVAAKGGFSDVGTVSDAVTTVLNAYGRSASDAAAITDVLIQTQNLGKITVAQYGSLIGRAATIASQAGVSFEEFSAFVSVATVKGVSAESTIAGLRQAISAILKPTKEASELSQKLGVDFSAQALRTKGLTGVLADLRAKGADGVDTLTQLFGSVEAVTAIAPATGAGFKDLQNALDGISNSGGAAQKAFDAVSSTFDNESQRAINLLNESLVSLGNGVKAALGPVLAGINLLLTSFNSLPEPIKGATGVAIALTGGLLSLGAVIAGIAAVVPSVVAGFGVINSLFLGSAAAAATAATATTGNTTATGLNLLALQLQAQAIQSTIGARLQSTGATASATAATAGNTAATLANAQAQGVANTATLGTIGNLLKLAGTAALGVGAVLAVVEAVKALGTAGGLGSSLDASKAVDEINKLQSKLKEPLPGIGSELTKQSLSDLEEAFQRTQKAFTEKGPIEGVRAGLVELQNAAYGAIPGFSGVTDSADKFGSALAINGKTLEVFGFNLGGLTASQREAQTSVLNFERVTAASLGTLDSASGLLQQYGLSSRKAAEEAASSGKLTTDQIASFKTAATSNIEALDANIKAVKAYGDANPAAAEQARALTANLEQQKAALQQRIALLSGNKQATDTLQTSLADLTSEFEKNQKAIANETTQATVNAKQLLSERVINEQEAQEKIFQAEKAGLDKRLSANNSQLEVLRAKLTGEKDPAKVAAINSEIEKLESDSAQTRISIADKVIGEQKRRQTEAVADLQKLRDSVTDRADRTQSAGSIQAKQSLLAGGSEEEAQKRITESRKQAAEQRVQGLNDELSQLRAARESGLIDAETATKKEREIQSSLRKEEESVLDARLELRRQFNQEQIRLAEEANANATSALKRSQNAQTATIRKAVLDRNLSEEQASVRLAKLRESQVSGETALIERRLQENDRFEQQGIRTAREAAKIRRDLLDQLSQQQVAAIDAQLASQKALEAEIIAGIQKRLNLEKSGIDFKAQELELIKTSGSQQLSLLDAQLGLQNALSELQAGRFQNAIAEQSAQASADQAALARALDQATTEEDRAKIQAAIEDQKRQSVRDRVALEQAAAQQQLTSLLQAQAIERQQLELKAQMQRIDADRAEKQAEIAVLESQAALATARARGASADELAILEKTVGLRQQQLKLASDNKGITDQQVNLEQQAAATRQQTALEAAQSKVRQTQVQGNEQVKATDFEIAKARIGRGVDVNDPTQKVTSEQQKKIDLSNPINRGPNFDPNALPPEVARTLSQQQGLPGQPLQPGQVPGAIAPGQPGQGQPVTEVIEAQPVFFVGQSVPLMVKDDLVSASIGLGLADIKQSLFGLNPVTAPVTAQINPNLVAPVPVQVGAGVQAKANQDIAAIATDSEAIRTIRDYAERLNQVASTPRSISVSSAGDPIKEAAELWEAVNRGVTQGALM